MNNQYSSQIERYQLDLTKLQTEIDEKQHVCRTKRSSREMFC